MSPLLPQRSSPLVRAQQIASWCAAMALVGGVVWFTGERIAHGETFQVSEVRFVGNDRASTAQLRHLSDIRSGTHLFKADLPGAVKGIEKHPWIRDATARRRFPASVEIHVREHEPSLLLALDKLWFVDGSGHVFKAANSESLDFPVLTGLSSEMAQEKPHVARAIIDGGIEHLHAVAAHPSIELAELSEIHFDRNLGYTLVLRSGSQVILGMSDPKPALGRLAQMSARGLDLSSPQRIDLGVGAVAIATPL